MDAAASEIPPPSPTLRDLLDAPVAATLASFLACDNKGDGASHSASGRTLLEIIRDEDADDDAGGDAGVGRWMTLRFLLRLTRAGIGIPRPADPEVADEPPAVAAEVPARVSLLALLEEADGPGVAVSAAGEEEEAEMEMEEEERRRWLVCGACEEREKGAAFVPCGHAFCRPCAGEIHRTRGGECPICRRVVIKILNLF